MHLGDFYSLRTKYFIQIKKEIKMSQVEKNKENLEMCNCLKCPSYSTSCKIKEMPHNMFEVFKGLENLDGLENLFCAYTKSRCIDEDKGCLCNVCRVHDKYNLEEGHYCISEGGY